MIAVDQTHFVGDPDGIPGNCMQAAIASVLEYPLDAVPHFAAMPEVGWWDAFLDYLGRLGLRLTMYADRFFETDVYLDGLLIAAPLSEWPADRIVIANGMSPRGVRHSVIWQHGEMIHDPHPSRAGLTEAPDEVWLITSREVTS
jgi:hypothetical protein